VNTSRIHFLVGIALALTVCSPAFAITYAPFTTPPSPGSVGFTYAGNKFVGSIAGNGTGLLYETDLFGGNVQVFAPTVNLANAPSTEHYVAASPGIGGWTGGEIYVADGSNVVHISNSGASSNTFVSGLGGEIRGIAFDLAGGYGNNMLITTTAGNVYRVTPGGTASLVANVQLGGNSVSLEGLDIAPAGFGTFGGQLFVASETSDSVFAVSSGGVVTKLTNGSLGDITIPSAEQLTFVPLNLGISGSPLEGLYSGNYAPNVLFANGSQFVGMEGDMILTGELTDKITRIHWNSGISQFVVTGEGLFPNNNGNLPSPQPEDGLFITPQLLAALPPNYNVPEPSSVALAFLGGTALFLAAFRRRRRQPR
jgi:hypothetical protein